MANPEPSRSKPPQTVLKPVCLQDGHAMRLTGMRRHYPPNNAENFAPQWEQFVPHLGNIPGQTGRVAYGVFWSLPNGGSDYLTGVGLAPEVAPPAGFDLIDLPPQRYAVFAHLDHVSALCRTVSGIFEQWLPRSGHSVARSSPETPFFLERYGERFNPETGRDDIEVWVPLAS